MLNDCTIKTAMPAADGGAGGETPRVTLLGHTVLHLGARRPLRLERKAAGLLAYLALQGETPRGKLAALLWPGGGEGIARNNLAQTIRRLKQAADGVPLVVGQAQLRLERGLELDIQPGETPVGEASADSIAQGGELLAGLDYNDCPDFDEWLQVNRRLFENRRVAALEALADMAETDNNLRAALEYAQRLLARDPYCETHHRRLMRLFWLMGDRNAALAACRKCRQTLQTELGVAPAAETLALEYSILRGQASAVGHFPSRPALPPALLRPPQLVEREFLLARMETAWANGQAVFVEGPAGIGKTRLMQESLGKHGRFYTFHGRPGELDIPYASISRQLREMFKAFPSICLADRVRVELACILPELGRSPGAPERSYDPLHLYPVLVEVMGLAVASGMRRVAFDNLHLQDQASISALLFACMENWERGTGMQMVFCYRREALAPEAGLLLDTLLTLDRAILIRVDGVSESGLAQLLAGIAPELAAMAGELYRHTGGNPFFSLETLRMLHHQNGQPEAATLACTGGLPMPRKVRHILEQALASLSPQALQLARVAALAGERFQPELAEGLLGLSPYVAASIWAELAGADILIGWRFPHEFARRAVIESLPEPVRERLMQEIAASGVMQFS